MDAIAHLVKLLFVFWFHMLWGAALVFAVAYFFFQIIVALIAQ